MHVSFSLIESTNLSYIVALTFNYPNNVCCNLEQQKGQRSTVTVLWAGEHGTVFRFTVGAKVFLVSKVSSWALVPNQLPI
jgi:hypothetical protein